MGPVLKVAHRSYYAGILGIQNQVPILGDHRIYFGSKLLRWWTGRRLAIAKYCKGLEKYQCHGPVFLKQLYYHMGGCQKYDGPFLGP